MDFIKRYGLLIIPMILILFFIAIFLYFAKYKALENTEVTIYAADGSKYKGTVKFANDIKIDIKVNRGKECEINLTSQDERYYMGYIRISCNAEYPFITPSTFVLIFENGKIIDPKPYILSGFGYITSQ